MRRSPQILLLGLLLFVTGIAVAIALRIESDDTVSVWDEGADTRLHESMNDVLKDSSVSPAEETCFDLYVLDLSSGQYTQQEIAQSYADCVVEAQ